jgi:two-component system, NtrC family, response regulator AtoC
MTFSERCLVRSLQVVLTVIRSPETRSLVRKVLEGAGHRVIEPGGYAQAELLLSNGLDPDLLLLESATASQSESEQFSRLLKIAPMQTICLITGVGDEKLRQNRCDPGIKYFLTSPLTRADIEALINEMDRSSVQGSQRDIVSCPTEIPAAIRSIASDIPASLLLEELGDDRFFLAASPKMLEIHRKVKLLADVDVAVLILGESGTGKELIANLIHKYSRRARHKFHKVNCAALPGDLIESELFGHQQGAFTGATKDRLGKFEQANRSTLLLDEIGELSTQMQAKLLHVLQDGQFTRLGGEEPANVDVRVLAATNVQMESALQEKTFREDLYYRLNAFTINVPPLRERREEIPYLIEETIRRSPVAGKNGREFHFSSRLMDAALLYDWRGNLRELRNFVTRTMIMQDEDAVIRELEAKIVATSAPSPQDIASSAPPHRAGMRSIVRDIKDRTEVQMLQDALDAAGWNRRHAAQHLKISYRALLYKIQQHRLAPRMSRV